MNLRALWIAFATLLGTGTMLGAGMTSLKAQSILQYRLLKLAEPNPGEIPRRLSYFVSVPSFLDRSGVERLVCKVIEKEKPTPGTDISVAIYQGLEKVSDTELVFGGAPYEHDLAIYVSRGGFLTVLRDLRGRRIVPVKTYEFDHSKACPHSLTVDDL